MLTCREREKESNMLQVMNLPYLLQSLVSTKVEACEQPQSRGTVHHYPAHCNDRSNYSDYNNYSNIGAVDRSSTTNSELTTRVNRYQCAVAERAGTRHGTAGMVQVKREVMDNQTQPGKS